MSLPEERECEGSTRLEPNRHGRSIALGVSVSALIVLCLGILCSVPVQDESRFNETRAKAAIDESAGIAEFRRFEIIHGVGTHASGIYVVVGPGFYICSFEQKVLAMRTVAAAVGADDGGNHFILYDWRDNHKVGAWRGADGLHLFK